MADSIQNKRTNQSYLRQIQQEKSQRKREIMQAQKEDMKAVRDFYAQQSKQLDQDSAAAVNHIKQESREIAAQERAERTEKIAMEQEQKRAEREERSGGARTASKAKSANADNKNVYTRSAKRSPVVQNYQTKETDDFYRVQDRGSRVTENPEAYIIEAYAPEHEKDDLRVSIQRNKAVVSGQRKFADEAEDGNKKMSTNNYQSFREEFAFDRPVSQAGMTRERVGDYIRFSIPKLEAVENAEEA